ncbi:hypothetical protein EGC76_08630 [Pseudidiomarina gelatinasegens]|jgi:hypothetical protein|uniref:Cohesin domain-containing protein n=1 Tax=Pseudidiomarina gelatinasegens TaxID=2487740 RepID=A0A443YZP0_9GAMM|nr:DUF6689 family protein [Pseudidiomarina gelatinasegens]RWU09679.1 hypothetical protein EGC76_08630 [Pseudidiomarina gelatinasegens]
MYASKTLLKVAVLLLGFSLSSYSTSAHAVEVPLTINAQQNSLNASVELSALVSFDISVQFENAVGLTPQNMTLEAHLLNLADPDILHRLPNSLLTTIPQAFPVLISISPDPAKGFAFSGAYTIEIYTKSLHYTEGTPLRLFHSHNNGTFADITTMTGSGSYRVRGNGGQFSDFIVLADLRDTNTIIQSKLARLQNIANNSQSLLAAGAYQVLSDAIDNVSIAMNSSNKGQALSALEHLIHLLEADNGTIYPDVWRSSNDLNNVRGNLISAATTLRFSLRIE